jgi:hypothetical protein
MSIRERSTRTTLDSAWRIPVCFSAWRQGRTWPYRPSGTAAVCPALPPVFATLFFTADSRNVTDTDYSPPGRSLSLPSLSPPQVSSSPTFFSFLPPPTPAGPGPHRLLGEAAPQLQTVLTPHLPASDFWPDVTTRQLLGPTDGRPAPIRKISSGHLSLHLLE